MEELVATRFIRNVQCLLASLDRVVLVKMWHAYDALPQMYRFSRCQISIIQLMKRLISDQLYDGESDGGNV